jgi:hypothetical protein
MLCSSPFDRPKSYLSSLVSLWWCDVVCSVTSDLRAAGIKVWHELDVPGGDGWKKKVRMPFPPFCAAAIIFIFFPSLVNSRRESTAPDGRRDVY